MRPPSRNLPNQSRSTANHRGSSPTPEPTKKMRSERVTVTAVNSEIKTPTIRAIAKPLTCPVPILANTTEERIVQALESIIAGNARLNPISIATLSDRPPRISSLNRSNTRMFASTAIPTERMKPAIEASENVASIVFSAVSVNNV